MSAFSVLIVDDEQQIRRVVRRALADDFIRIFEASTGGTGIEIASAEKPELIILDLGLPDMDGLLVCAELKRWSTAAILVLSARYADEGKMALLDAGADEYVTKPFNTIELKARVRALLRRTYKRALPVGSIISCGELSMDLAARELTLAGAPLHLTPIEWDLLRELMTQSGRTLTHTQLFAAVSPGASAGDAQQYLRVHVASIRRKIESNPLEPHFIMTEPGVGYRFVSCR